MSCVFEVVGDEVKILGQTKVTARMFKNLDAALDFCKFAEPESLAIERVYSGGKGGINEVVGYQLSYTGGKEKR